MIKSRTLGVVDGPVVEFYVDVDKNFHGQMKEASVDIKDLLDNEDEILVLFVFMCHHTVLCSTPVKFNSDEGVFLSTFIGLYSVYFDNI